MPSHRESLAIRAGGGRLGNGDPGRRWAGGGDHPVALFLSTWVNKVDKKGRVSVPASFRATLAGQSFAGIVVFRSFRTAALEGSGIDRIEEMSARLDQLHQVSED